MQLPIFIDGRFPGPVRNIAGDLSLAFRGMLADGHTPGGIKKLLNEAHLPTISGKRRWTLGGDPAVGQGIKSYR